MKLKKLFSLLLCFTILIASNLGQVGVLASEIDTDLSNEIIKQYELDGKEVLDIKILHNTDSESFTSIQSVWGCPTGGYDVKNVKRGGESWGLNDFARYYLAPGGGFSRSISRTEEHNYSFSVGFESEKSISAELGYGFTTSRTVTEEISYTNPESYSQYLSLHVIYQSYSYDLYTCGHIGSPSSKIGSGTVLIPVGIAQVVYR